LNIPCGGQTPPKDVSAVEAFVTIELDARDPGVGARIAARVGCAVLDRLLVFASPDADLVGILSTLSEELPGLPVVGCTTAGEIGAEGYVTGRVVAVGLPAARFASRSLLIEGLGELRSSPLSSELLAARVSLLAERPEFGSCFAFLMIDGLSLREDALAAMVSASLGGVPLFGGSAGDGTRFGRTLVAMDGRVLSDAAVLTLVATDYRAEVFSLDHLRPTGRRMVVTRADPATRTVYEINAEPAAAEFARVTGLPSGDLDEFIFATHPVVVRFGERHHVRAIQRVLPDGALVFYSAVDEGMVLSVAEPVPIGQHLDRALTELSGEARPAGILACDCILRRIEAEQRQQDRDVSEVLARHRVRGFSTYGEQRGPMHLNQTMTGVLLFAPEDV
jgi:hypothetical protein